MNGGKTGKKGLIAPIILIVVLSGVLFLFNYCQQPPKQEEPTYTIPTPTATVPTETLEPTPEPTPVPTAVPEPTPVPTDIPEPTPEPTTTLVVVDSGKGMSLASLKVIRIFNDMRKVGTHITIFLICVCAGWLIYRILKEYFSTKEDTKN